MKKENKIMEKYIRNIRKVNKKIKEKKL